LRLPVPRKEERAGAKFFSQDIKVGMDIKLLIALLPVVFIFHDFEEIIMFGPWLRKNRAEVRRRFPRLDKTLVKNHDRLSTSGFAVAVMHEFLVVAIITVLSLCFDSYFWWFGAFAAFSIHLVVHIGQWIVYGKYVPVIVTSALTLPYSIYTFFQFIQATDLAVGQMLFSTGLGIALTALSFISAFALALRFEEWKNKKYLQSGD
jgi:hypothetical protein